MSHNGDNTTTELTLEQISNLMLLELRKQTILLEEFLGTTISNDDLEEQ